jgi:hypothetical protein
VKNDPNPGLRDAYNHYFDAAAWHWYSNPRHLYEKTVEMRALMAQYGITGKEIWVNESGVPVWDEYPGPTQDPNSPGRATLQEQAAWVFQAFAEGFAAGVKRIFFFQLYDDCGNGPSSFDAYGLIRNLEPEGPGQGVCAKHPERPGEPRPAYTAYQVAADVFRDVEPVWRYHDYASGLGRVALFRPPDERVLVVWNWAFEDKTFAIPRTGTTGELIDLQGNRQTIAPEGAVYRITLPAATNANWDEPGAMIGGQPYILIEQDTLAPSAQVDPLPEASAPTFDVTWELQDWGTGVTAYEIWYSDGAPQSAADWQVLVPETPVDPPQPQVRGSIAFSGQEGHTYYFAARARDRAGNWSPLGEPQAWTTVQTSGFVAGHVLDLRARPVASATVQVVLDASTVATATTDVDGRFVAAGIPFGTEYGISASAEGYGTWPARWGITPTATATHQITLYLPPGVSVVTNGGFETGDLDGWERGGDTLPIRSNFGFTGQDRERPKAALLGFRSNGGAPGTSRLSQVLRIPAGDAPTLGFWYRIIHRHGTAPTPSLNRFRVLAEPMAGSNAPPQTLYEETLTGSVGWRYRWVDLTDLAGQEVRLTFEVLQPSADFQTVVYLDHVAVGEAEPFRATSRVLLPLVGR